MFKFVFGILCGLILGGVIRQRKLTGVTQTRLDAYYHRRAKLYHLTDYLYLGQFPRVTMRTTLLDMTRLKAGDHVLDFACGSGANFPYIMERIGAAGHLTATDYSQDMLDAAQEQQVSANGWQNVTLVQGDAAEMAFEQPFDVVICTLGLAVIPQYEQALERAWALVKPGGVLGIADIAESTRWYTQPIRFLTDLIDVAIIADSSRAAPVNNWLKQHGGETYRYQEIFHGYFYAATIQKPDTP